MTLIQAAATSRWPTWAPAPAASEANTQHVIVRGDAGLSASGLPKAYDGALVARGGRIGLLGEEDMMDSPFAVTNYTGELIQNQQARGVGDVLLNDPSVRVARGFGNFQEAYFIRGFLLDSDSLTYDGLHGILPRQFEVRSGGPPEGEKSQHSQGAGQDGSQAVGAACLLKKAAVKRRRDR